MENNMIDPHNELTAGVKRNLPRDVFLHLLAMVTLYWSAVSFIMLCWQYVNYFFPDVLNYGYYDFSGSIRFAVSSLIIVFPIFLIVSWFLNKIYTKESAVRESKMRKWLIYLTLFVASLVIIGDLIYVINTFLSGDLTMRFILKALSVLIVALVIFWYYLDDVRKNAPSALGKYLAVAPAVVVVAFIVGAFFIVGSPKQARLEQIDQQLVNDLQSIQWQIVNYWQRKGAVPTALVDLNDSISGYTVPVDPETKLPYEYTANFNPALPSFELCATFNSNSAKQPNVKSMPVPYPVYNGIDSQTWDHTAGRVCFKRVIDQQLYPPLNQGK